MNGEAARPSLIASKRVSWTELFYDLVLVFAVNKVAHTLARDVSWSGLIAAWAVFTPFWWSWVGSGILANLTDMNRVRHRLRLFAITLVTSLMTLAVPTALTSHAVYFATEFVLLRTLLVWWAVEGFGGLRLNPFSVSGFFTAPMMLIGALLLPPEARRVVWAALMVIEMSSTFLLRRRLTHIRVDVAHLPERFGLVVILALSVPFVEAGGLIPSAFTVAQAVALAFCFLLVSALWWVYFHFTNSAIEHQLRNQADHSRVVRELLAYGHYCLLGSVSALAVGAWQAVAHPGLRVPSASLWLLSVGVAVFHTVYVWPRWGLPRGLVAIRLSVAGMALVAGSATAELPGIAVIGAQALVVCAGAVAETVLLGAAPACSCGCRTQRLLGLARHLAAVSGVEAAAMAADQGPGI